MVVLRIPPPLLGAKVFQEGGFLTGIPLMDPFQCFFKVFSLAKIFASKNFRLRRAKQKQFISSGVFQLRIPPLKKFCP